MGSESGESTKRNVVKTFISVVTEKGNGDEALRNWSTAALPSFSLANSLSPSSLHNETLKEVPLDVYWIF
jgi:hypothetical protein